MSYFSCNIHRKKKIEVVLDLSNYATKFDLKTQQVLIYHNWLKKVI